MLKHQKHTSLTCGNNDPLTHLINVEQLPSECETLTQKHHHVRHHHIHDHNHHHHDHNHHVPKLRSHLNRPIVTPRDV